MNLTSGKFTLQLCDTINCKRRFGSIIKNWTLQKKRRGKAKQKDGKIKSKVGQTCKDGAF